MQKTAMNEVALDLREGAEESWVVGLQEPELEQAEQAGVDILAAEGGNQAVEALVPGSLEDADPDLLGLLRPDGGAVEQVEAGGDLGEPVARGPAHDSRIGVHLLPGAQLPEGGIGPVPQAHGLVAEAFQLFDHADVAGVLEARIEDRKSTRLNSSH